MRAVLDVNVLVSALLSRGGTPAQIVSSWLTGEFELVVSEALIAELERALEYPKVRTRISAEDAAAYVELLREGAVAAADPPMPPRRLPDPGDDYLLALAEAQKAVLVTGDQHLLELVARFPIRTPRAFLEGLQGPSAE
ncbi:putative toxin-antitoxin system toxin component, PIN family [soil metagenome]